MIIRFIQTALICGIPFGLAMGLFFFMIGYVNNVLFGLLCGLLFGLAIAVFMEFMRKKMESKDNQFEGELVVFQGPANHFCQYEGRGGWLTLTKTRLCFRSHGTNFNNQPLNIPIEAITTAEATKTWGLIPNGLRVSLKTGYTESIRSESFVVNGRSLWVEQINSQINSPVIS